MWAVGQAGHSIKIEIIITSYEMFSTETSSRPVSALKECLCVSLSFFSLYGLMSTARNFSKFLSRLCSACNQCNHALCTWMKSLFWPVCLSSPLFLSTSCLRVSWTSTWQTWGKVGRTSPASSSSTTLSPASVVLSSSGWSLTTKTPKCPRVDSKYCFVFFSDLSSFSAIFEILIQEESKATQDLLRVSLSCLK